MTQPTQKHERRNIINERAIAKIETRDDGKHHCVGYSAVFYRAGVAGTEFEMFENTFERIMPGAFDDIGSDDVRGLFNHSALHILGRNVSGTLKLDVDETGLRYDITLPDTQVGRDLVETISRGDVSGSSFAFRVVDDNWSTSTTDEVEVTVREVFKVKTFDVGPVTYPAYTGTSTDVANRSLDSYRLEISQRLKSKTSRSRRAKLARLRK